MGFVKASTAAKNGPGTNGSEVKKSNADFKAMFFASGKSEAKDDGKQASPGNAEVKEKAKEAAKEESKE